MPVFREPIPRTLCRKVEHRGGDRLIRLGQLPPLLRNLGSLFWFDLGSDGRGILVKDSNAVMDILYQASCCAIEIQAESMHRDGHEVSKCAVLLRLISPMDRNQTLFFVDDSNTLTSSFLSENNSLILRCEVSKLFSSASVQWTDSQYQQLVYRETHGRMFLGVEYLPGESDLVDDPVFHQHRALER